MKKIFIIMLLFLAICSAIEIKPYPIKFSENRVELTKKYIKDRYNLEVKDITIIPKMIVIHHTESDSLEESYERLNAEELFGDMEYIRKGGNLNVSAHFLVDRDGSIYSLMPENYMARHCIGLNYSSIGIENVGGKTKNDHLTKEQLNANIELISYLKAKYKTIEYLIGHYEYLKFEKHPYFIEKADNYRTWKRDPSQMFMEKLRENFKDLKYE